MNSRLTHADDPSLPPGSRDGGTGTVANVRARAEHFGVSAVILGVALVFLGFLVRAERRDLQALVGASAQCQSTTAISPSAADGSTCSPSLAATRGAQGYANALLAAEAGVALAALTLLARRRRLWIGAACGVIVCMSAATATFTQTRVAVRSSSTADSPAE